MKDTWSTIVGADALFAQQLDPNTVSLLEGKSMSLSISDRAVTETSIRNGILFPRVQNSEQRKSLQTRIFSIEYRIPSLHLFLEDTKIMEPCSRILKELLPANFKGSIREAFQKRHNGHSVVHVDRQYENKFEVLNYNLSQSIAIAYQAIWLFVWRHFPEMTDIQPRQDAGRNNTAIKSSRLWWNCLGHLAAKAGFESEAITQLIQQSSDELMTQEFLQQIRPNEYYDNHDLAAETQRICQYLNTIKPRNHCFAEPVFTTDLADLDLTHRCGRPYLKAFMDNKKFLFLHYMYLEHQRNGRWPVNRKNFITPLAIIRDTFRAFFDSPFPSDPVPSTSQYTAVAEEILPVNSSNNATIPQTDETRVLDTDLLINLFSNQPPVPTLPQSTLDSIQIDLGQEQRHPLLLEYPSSSNQSVLPVDTMRVATDIVRYTPIHRPRYWWRKSPILLTEEICALQVIEVFLEYQPEDFYTKPYLLYRPATREVHLYEPTRDALQGVFSQEEVYWTWHFGQWKTVAAFDLCRAAQQGGNVVILGVNGMENTSSPDLIWPKLVIWHFLTTENENEGAWEYLEEA